MKTKTEKEIIRNRIISRIGRCKLCNPKGRVYIGGRKAVCPKKHGEHIESKSYMNIGK